MNTKITTLNVQMQLQAKAQERAVIEQKMAEYLAVGGSMRTHNLHPRKSTDANMVHIKIKPDEPQAGVLPRPKTDVARKKLADKLSRDYEAWLQNKGKKA